MRRDVEGISNPSDDETKRNAWFMRVARYFAYCVDGGIFGAQFTLFNLIEYVGALTAEANKKILEVIFFLVHLRSPDYSKPFTGTHLQDYRDPLFSEWIMNDRVVQVLVEESFVSRLFQKGQELQHVILLSNLLLSEKVGVPVKVSICRQVLETHTNLSQDCMQTLVSALVEVMRQGHVYLSTYAVAVLVNVSHQNESTKSYLMGSGVAPLAVGLLKAGSRGYRSDDDLVLYTITLLVNLTKSVLHRTVLISHGVLPVVVDLLTQNYASKPKAKMLTQLCAVLGQFANDDDARRPFTKEYPVVDCLLFIFDTNIDSGNYPLKAKVMFALKQMC